ncbi:serine hydrolase [Mucilaginibacter sp.]|uniref:serine hydrolase n=1 Tax=Mucilaginibacter sp. TaxID=1882438 RepID=UPI0032639B9A
MKKIFCFFLSVLSIATLKAQQSQLQNIAEDNGLPGIQLAYTNKGKTTEYNLGTGKEGLTKQITTNTLFRAGSLGKSVFAYAVLRLCDRGVLSLDTPLMHYIGTYSRFDMKDPRYSMITARMVLSHTSGLAEFPQFETGEPVKLLFAPGSSYAYSGEGYWFLQKVIEKLTGMHFEQVMQEEVFKPLGMHNSTYVQTKEMDISVIGPESPDLAPMLPNAAFSLLSNAHDYNLFLQALLVGKGLKPATHQRMFSKQLRKPQGNTDTAKYVNWGLGVGLVQGKNQNLIWHWGKTDDFISLFVANPATGQSLVFFTRGPALKVADQIISLFLGRQTALTMRPLHFRYDEPDTMARLFSALRAQGFGNVPAVFKGLQSKGYQFSEGDINYYGNVLLRNGKNRQALAIFKQQVAMYPASANARDSFAAAAESLGDTSLAITNYKQSLKLDTANQSAAYHIKSLQHPGFTAAQLGAFTGKFTQRGSPQLYLRFAVKGNVLILTQSWDNHQLEFFRVDDLEFYNTETTFKLRFEKDKAGSISKAFVATPVEWQKVGE